jgi:hypothetical protein
MKRLFAIVLLLLVAAQLYLLPMSVQATIPCPVVTTLDATNITESTATLNGSVSIPSIVKNAVPNGIIPVSLEYAGIEPIQAFVSFQYGTTPGVYSNETPQIMLTQSGTFQAAITGLPSCTTHYARTKVQTNIIPGLFKQYRDSLQGAGVGLDYKCARNLYIPNGFGCPVSYGNIVSFDTIGCQTYIGTGSHGAGGISGFGNTPPSNPPIVGVSSAAVASTRVSPGDKVDISATISNKGGSVGTSKVTLFINGQEEESKGVTLASGESTTMHFSVSRSDPGTYTVNVNNVPAGSFTVDQFKNNDALIYGVIALFIIGIAGILYLLIRKRTA